MIIGFLCTELDTLILFKKVVQEYPLHGYVFYCDTAGTAIPDDGVAFLIEKGCKVFVVEDESLVTKVKALVSVQTVITQAQLDSFLENAVQEGAVSTVRIIHLTQHSKETDKKISEVLSGYFITD